MIPRILQPGVLSYEAWLSKSDKYLESMLEYIDDAIKNVPPTPGMIIKVDRAGLYDAFCRYLYSTSVNRFRRYEIIH